MSRYHDTDDRPAPTENSECCPDLPTSRDRSSWAEEPHDASVVDGTAPRAGPPEARRVGARGGDLVAVVSGVGGQPRRCGAGG